MNKIIYILLTTALAAIFPLKPAWGQETYVDPSDNETYSDTTTDTGVNTDVGVTGQTDQTAQTDLFDENGLDEAGIGPMSSVAACPLDQYPTNYDYGTSPNYYGYGTSSDYGYGGTGGDLGTAGTYYDYNIPTYPYTYPYTYTVPSYYYGNPVVVSEYPYYSSFFYPGGYYGYRPLYFNHLSRLLDRDDYFHHGYRHGYGRSYAFSPYRGHYGRFYNYPHGGFYNRGLTSSNYPYYRSGLGYSRAWGLNNRVKPWNQSVRAAPWPGNRSNLYDSGTGRYVAPRSGIAQRQYLNSGRIGVPGVNRFNRPNLNDSGTRIYRSPRFNTVRPFRDGGTSIGPHDPTLRRNFSSPMFRSQPSINRSFAAPLTFQMRPQPRFNSNFSRGPVMHQSFRPSFHSGFHSSFNRGSFGGGMSRGGMGHVGGMGRGGGRR